MYRRILSRQPNSVPLVKQKNYHKIQNYYLHRHKFSQSFSSTSNLNNYKFRIIQLSSKVSEHKTFVSDDVKRQFKVLLPNKNNSDFSNFLFFKDFFLRAQTHVADSLKQFLPKNYPKSVSKNYLPYVGQSLIASIFSAASGVLATKSMLLSIGLSQGIIPISAALNQIIKDGIGQLGGIAFAHRFGNRMDSECKRQRFMAAFYLEVSVLIEILTIFTPNLFLPMASIANIGKNISAICASATKATIHKNLCREENLSDVTSKATSQTIASSLIGTGLGIAISLLPFSSVQTLIAFSILSLLHLSSIYMSLKHISLNMLNFQRMNILTKEFYNHGKIISTPNQISLNENILLFQNKQRCFSSSFQNLKVHFSSKIENIELIPSDLEYQHKQLNLKSFLKIIPDKTNSSKVHIYVLTLEAANSFDLIRSFLAVYYFCAHQERYSNNNLLESRFNNKSLKCEELLNKCLEQSGNNFQTYIKQLNKFNQHTNNVFFEKDFIRLKMIFDKV